ncbi:kynureninase, partial [Paeniglutamicibacter sp. NPDC091659]
MSTPTLRTDRASLQAADKNDSLARFRERFSLPEGLIYLDGNSLGPLPLGAAERAADVINNEWAHGLIRSWNTAGWFELPTRLGDKLSKLIGGNDGETVVTDTTSLNLFKALA